MMLHSQQDVLMPLTASKIDFERAQQFLIGQIGDPSQSGMPEQTKSIHGIPIEHFQRIATKGVTERHLSSLTTVLMKAAPSPPFIHIGGK